MNIEHLKDTYNDRYSTVNSVDRNNEMMVYFKYQQILLPNFDCRSKSMLDLGCGLGFKTKGFSANFKLVDAIDLSEEAIKKCQNESTLSNINFHVGNVLEVKKKYDLITAFGFSLFNTKNNHEFVEMVSHFLFTNIEKQKGNQMIISSFTDFSGKNENSWYRHTKNDLAQITQSLEQMNTEVSIVFPHKIIKNYLNFGVKNFFKELYKLLFKKNKIFFIKIVHG